MNKFFYTLEYAFVITTPLYLLWSCAKVDRNCISKSLWNKKVADVVVKALYKVKLYRADTFRLIHDFVIM